MFPVRECPWKTGVKASPCKHGKYFGCPRCRITSLIWQSFITDTLPKTTQNVQLLLDQTNTLHSGRTHYGGTQEILTVNSISLH